MKPKQIVYSRIEAETVSYLKEVARHNDRSFSYVINRILSHAAEKHRAAKTGNQASLDLLQLLGPSPAQAANGQRDSGLLQRSIVPTQEGARKP